MKSPYAQNSEGISHAALHTPHFTLYTSSNPAWMRVPLSRKPLQVACKVGAVLHSAGLSCCQVGLDKTQKRVNTSVACMGASVFLKALLSVNTIPCVCMCVVLSYKTRQQ